MQNKIDTIELLDYLEPDTLAYLIRDIETALEKKVFNKQDHKKGIEEVFTTISFAYYLLHARNHDDETGEELLLKAYNHNHHKAYDAVKQEIRAEIYGAYLCLFFGEDGVLNQIRKSNRDVTVADGCRMLMEALRNHPLYDDSLEFPTGYERLFKALTGQL